jgi:glycosyltransferase involved in cell wall biosynthesis
MNESILRLGLVATHPVQYQVPWYRALAAVPGVDLTVFYALLPDAHQQGVGFGVDFRWDLPLFEGYRHELLTNVAHRPSLGRFGGCDTPAIREVVRQRGLDACIISGWGGKTYLQALWACRRNGTPTVVRGESNALRKRSWPVRVAHRLLLRQYTAFLAIGKSNGDFYRRNGVRPDRIFSGPYCVDNEYFAREAERLRPRRAEFKRRWGIPPSAYTFLFCGKLVKKKRPFDALRAVARAAEGEPSISIHLLIVGDGPLRDECESLTKREGLPVSFTGFLNQGEIPAAYVAADCLVLPSDYGETWGLVVNEAMACGLPAIVSDRVGCHPDLVNPGQTGAVFACGDIPGLARELRGFALGREQWPEITRKARSKAAEYSVDRLLAGSLRATRYAAANRLRY